MHCSAFVLIAECYMPYVQGLMQNYYRPGVSLEAVSLFLRGRGKTMYILPSSDTTLALLLMRFTEYDDGKDILKSQNQQHESQHT
ncbi:hypothetical protein Hanom_Chr07g00638501 [Helianthus anomalus]